MKQALRALRLGASGNSNPTSPVATTVDHSPAHEEGECRPPAGPSRTESAGSMDPDVGHQRLAMVESHQLQGALTTDSVEIPQETQCIDDKEQPTVVDNVASLSPLQDQAPPPSTNNTNKPDIPPSFQCPISMDIMLDPVILATGHTYDRRSIERWLLQGHRTCPVTGVRLRHTELTPNFALRSAIADWAALHNIHLPCNVAGNGQETKTLLPRLQPAYTPDVPTTNILQGHEEIIWALDVGKAGRSPRRLYSASADKTVRAWDMDTQRCTNVLEDHTRPVLSLASTESLLFSGSYDYTIRVWNLTTMTKVTTLVGHTDAVRTLIVTGGRLFSGSYDGTLRVWNVDTLECVATLQGHSGPVRTLTCCAGRVFSGSYDKTVRVWNVESLQCVATLKGHTGAVRALVATDTMVFSGSDDTTIRAWDATTLRGRGTLIGHEDNVRVLAVTSPRDTTSASTRSRDLLFSGSWDKTVRVWDAKTLECLQVLEGHTEAVLALAVTNQYLVSGSYDTTLRFWDLDTWRCVRRCEGHDDAVRVLASSAEGVVYSGSYDGSIGVW